MNMQVNSLERYGNHIISEKSTVQDVINTLIFKGILKDKTSPDILFITDSNNKLLGIISLSDLSKLDFYTGSIDLGASITTVMNKTPKTIYFGNVEAQLEEFFEKFPKISTVPVVDSNGLLKAIAENKKNTYAVDIDFDLFMRVMKKNDLLKEDDGITSTFWYRSFINDSISRHLGVRWVADFLTKNCNKKVTILETGCGLGLFSIWLSVQGFENVYAFDLTKNCIKVAEELAASKNLKVHFSVDDGLNPKNVPEQCDVITALGWVYAVWSLMYSDINNNLVIGDSYTMLDDFISKYSHRVRKNGLLILELRDSLGYEWFKHIGGKMPVMHSLEDVEKACKKHNFEIIEKLFGGNYLATYVLRKLL